MKLAIIALVMPLAACDGDNPSAPSSEATTAVVRIVFRGSTVRRGDLPPSAQACVDAVGATHTHPSWRNFSTIPLQPVPPDRYEISLDDAPVGVRVSFRINDQNFCDQNPTGAVTRDVSVNGVNLIQNTVTPGQGDEPGYAFSVAADGRVSQ